MKKLTKSFLIYGLSAGISKSLSIFLVPLYTRMFSPEEYGIYDMIYSIVLLSAIVGMFQFDSAVARYFYEAKENAAKKKLLSTGFWSILLISGGILVLSESLSFQLSHGLWGTGDYESTFRLAFLIIPLYNIYSYLSLVLRFQNRPLLYAIIALSQLLTTLGSILYFVIYKEAGIEGIFLGQLIGFSLPILIQVIFLHNHLFNSIDRKIFIKLHFLVHLSS